MIYAKTYQALEKLLLSNRDDLTTLIIYTYIDNKWQ